MVSLDEEIKNKTEFDLTLAKECAHAFYRAIGISCTISDASGQILTDVGGSNNQCHLCEKIHPNTPLCEEVHRYGMGQAERFGGRYIYFCPNGLTFFVSPISNMLGSVAKITAGPFLMVELDDFISLELEQNLQLKGESLQHAITEMKRIPYVKPEQAESLSILLFMAVSFVSNVWVANQLLQAKDAEQIQGNIFNYLVELKQKNESSQYPLEIETELLRSIANYETENANEKLNQLLGFILFSYGGDLAKIKSKIVELIVLMSRAAIDGGADSESTLNLNYKYMEEIRPLHSMEHLCHWLNKVMRNYMDHTIQRSDLKHLDIIHKAVHYMNQYYQEKITLEVVAKKVHLSPSYFSKIFKEEMNTTFSTYLNKKRIEKSKKLLLKEEHKLIDIAFMVGYEDQSYFTRVFKQITGVSPSKYRETHGKSLIKHQKK